LRHFEQDRQTVLSGVVGVRDVVWIAHISPTFQYNDADIFKALDSHSPLQQTTGLLLPSNLKLAVEHAMKRNQSSSLVYAVDDHTPWIYEIFPCRGVNQNGVLLIAWDFQSVVEHAIAKLPIAGQDIHYIYTKKDYTKIEYFHVSRSRELYPSFTDNRHFHWNVLFSVEGERWEAQHDSAPAFSILHPIKNAWFVLYLGLLFTCLLTLFIYFLYRKQRLIENQVNIKTHQLVSEKHRVERLMNVMAEGVLDVNHQGCCTYVNARALEILGYQEEQILGENIHVLIHHSDKSGHEIPVESCPILNALHTGEAISMENEVFWRADGEAISVNYHVVPMFSESQSITGLVVTFLDVSCHIQAKENEMVLRRQVEHTQRLESLGVLAGGIAHDFNNLLTSILGNTEMALQHTNDLSPASIHLQKVERASQRAADLCQQMLAYAGESQFVLKSVQLTELVENMRELLDVTAHKAVGLYYNIPDTPLALIEGDEAQLQQVILNILTNAGEAIDANDGKIIVSIGEVDVDTAMLQAAYAEEGVKPGKFVYIEVTDNGCGMDEVTIERMFEPFFTTKVTGRGLGMSTALGIVRSHKGLIQVESGQTCGTRIRVCFPALHKRQKTKKSIEAGQTITTQKSVGSVLVVDDEAALRELAGHALEGMGYDVLYAENGEKALRIFKEHSDDIILVILDLTMPNMGGKACFDILRDMKEDVQILFSSGYSEEAYAYLNIPFLSKPYTLKELSDKVKEVLGE